MMRPTERIDLIGKVARKLQSRYRFEEINSLLEAYKISQPIGSPGFNSKWTYVKEALKDINDKLLMDIAEELKISGSKSKTKVTIAPKIWKDSKDFRLFISHLAVHKNKAAKLKDILKSYNISSFVAHEDIAPTLPWQKEIEKALNTMDALLCIHTKGFAASPWTQQEIGFGIGRNIKIISLHMDEDPKGFISKNQAILRKGKDAAAIAKEINQILTSDFLTKDKMAEVQLCAKNDK